jgi:NADPH-dependent ferric siderophore reductase
MSAKGKLARVLGGVLLQRARVAELDEVAPGFQFMTLQGDVPEPMPGAKVQVLLPSDDMRTYTPIASKQGFQLLAWKHAGGPGARWLSEVKIGDVVQFMGPQRSLSLDAGPVILVGDETSIAVAATFEGERPERVYGVFLVQSPDAARKAARAVGLLSLYVAARDDVAGAVRAVVARQARSPGTIIALTGGSELVLSMRGALRERGVRDIKTKTYWIPGKAGLD